MKSQTIIAALISLTTISGSHAQDKLLNASYDVGREVYAAINEAFVPAFKEQTGRTVTIEQSHAGSSAQARSILEGLKADVVTFNQVADVIRLAEGGLIDKDWQTRLPHSSAPFTSLHSILVRKGNPKGIKDWSDLANPGVEIVQVNPKTGGNGRYTVLSYYADALARFDKDEAKAKEFLKSVLANVVVFEQGGRAATVAFTERSVGDVLVTFESEALQLSNSPDSQYEIVTPSTSVTSEFPVAVVDRVAKANGTVELATAYLEFLYTDEAQKIIGQKFYRPRNESILAEFDFFSPVAAGTVSELFGNEQEANERFFASGGLYDQVTAELSAKR